MNVNLLATGQSSVQYQCIELLILLFYIPYSKMNVYRFALGELYYGTYLVMFTYSNHVLYVLFVFFIKPYCKFIQLVQYEPKLEIVENEWP